MRSRAEIRSEFPIFRTHPQLVYLDSAATSLTPRSVIDALVEYYTEYNANIHRGIYHIAEMATEEYEETRKIMALYIHATRPEEIIFTKGTTEGVNLIASCVSEKVTSDSTILVTSTEHHSNFVPWQRLAEQKKATLAILDVDDDGMLHPSDILNGKVKIDSRTAVFALGHVSNVTGCIQPVKELIAAAKKMNPRIITVVDAAQSVPHLKVDVQDLGCDVLVFSGHKMLGPTGVGVLWGKYELLDSLSPYQTGGSMIEIVTREKTIYAQVPARFEAGTPPIAEVIALKAAVEYLEYIGLSEVGEYSHTLAQEMIESMRVQFGARIHFIGNATRKDAGIISFTIDGVHPHDIAQILGDAHIAVRAGHHCAQPLHTRFGLQASVRASMYLYSTPEDISKCIDGIKNAIKIFSPSRA